MLASRQSMTTMSLVSSQFRHQKSAVIHPYWTFIRDRGTYQKKYQRFKKNPFLINMHFPLVLAYYLQLDLYLVNIYI